MDKNQADKVLNLLRAIPDISELTMTPGIFHNGIDYDCDNCQANRSNAGDIYDEGVCFSCWENAIRKS